MTEGSASNVIGMLRRLGCPPPPVGEVESIPLPRWYDYGEDCVENEQVPCSRCDGSGLEPTDDAREQDR